MSVSRLTMKRKFFLRLLVFTLLFLPLNHVLTRAYVRFTRQPYVYEYTRKKFASLQDEVSLLVAGDSHALNAFNDTLVPGSYNYATPSESPIHIYFKLRAAFEQSDFQPRVVVLPVDLHTFSSFRADKLADQDPAFWAQYVDYIEVGREQGELFPLMVERVKAEFAYLGGLDNVLEILLSSEPWVTDSMEKGFRPTYEQFSSLSPGEQTEIAEKRTSFHLGGKDYLAPIEVTYFNRLLDMLEAQQVQIVFVWYPISEEYYEQSSGFVPVEDHFATMQNLFGDRENTLWLDYHDLFWEVPAYYRDSDHLNVDGAQVFTEQFIRDLEANGVSW